LQWISLRRAVATKSYTVKVTTKFLL
jgi:hypothetical protein